MNIFSTEELIKHNLHLGHKSRKIHPGALKYVYKVDRGVAIIDLAKTQTQLEAAGEYLENLGELGKTLLVVATKRQVKNVIKELCQTYGVFSLTNKWVGGFLTNFNEISRNTEKLRALKQDRDSDEWQKYPKHEVVKLKKQLSKIESIYGGVTELKKIPDAIFVVDVRKEKTAMDEAVRAGVATIGFCDTNADPGGINYPIVANDDSASSVAYVVEALLSSYSRGLKKIKN